MALGLQGGLTISGAAPQADYFYAAGQGFVTAVKVFWHVDLFPAVKGEYEHRAANAATKPATSEWLFPPRASARASHSWASTCVCTAGTTTSREVAEPDLTSSVDPRPPERRSRERFSRDPFSRRGDSRHRRRCGKCGRAGE